MPSSDLIFRIFVSSTFDDFKLERDALRKRVFPNLRKLCEEHGASFQAVDLRWGISREASEDQQTMKICFSEIDRCRRVTPRPNLIVLLGDRYGWRPLPYEIPANEFEWILDFFNNDPAGAKTAELLGQWYKCDHNSVPKKYLLLPRMGKYVNFENWKKIERLLFLAFNKAVNGLNIHWEKRANYITSATEREITYHGVLKNSADNKAAFCFFRHISGLPIDRKAKDYIDLDKYGNLDKEAFTRLTKLKHRLKKHIPENVHEYRTLWNENGISTKYLDGFCNDVYKVLKQVVLLTINHSNIKTPLQKEIKTHEQYAKERCKVFVGRKKLLDKINRYIGRENRYPLLIHGQSGVGKTSLIAHVAKTIKKYRKNTVIISRFIGATAESTNDQSLLLSLCSEISDQYEEDSTDLPVEYKELVYEFLNRLSLATRLRPLIMFLDNIEKVGNRDSTSSFEWLPWELPKYVHLVVSSRNQDCFNSLKGKIPHNHFYELLPIEMHEGDLLLNKWLTADARTLQENQKKLIMKKFESNRLPLFLRIAFEEARRWSSYDTGLQLADDIDGIIRDFLSRLSENVNHGKMLVYRSLSYLAAAKNGLSQNELMDIFSVDNDVMVDFRQRHQTSPYTDQLPDVVWSRLHFDLLPYLTDRSADGINVIDFYHSSFREVIEQDYLKENGGESFHKTLANYFGGQKNQKGETSGLNAPNLRKLSELPFQLTRGHLWDETQRLLMDFDFLKAKISAFGPGRLIEDYDFAFKYCVLNDTRSKKVKSRILEYVRDAIEMSSHAIAHDQTLLRSQLIGRLKHIDDEKIRFLLEEAGRKPELHCLLPLTSSLSPVDSPLVKTHITPKCDAIAATPDARFAVVAKKKEQLLVVIDLDRDLILNRLEVPWVEWPYNMNLFIARNGHMVICIAEESKIRIWSLETGKLIRSIPIYSLPKRIWDSIMSSSVHSPNFAVCPNNQTAISSVSSKTIKVLDLASGSLKKTLKSKSISRNISTLAVSADSRRVISNEEDFPGIDVWDVETGEWSKYVFNHFYSVNAFAFTSDNNFIVSGGKDRTIRIWDIQNLKQISILLGHNSTVTELAILPDDRILSASIDKSLRLWDPDKKKEIRCYTGHERGITSLNVMSDGHCAISGSIDQTCRVWDLETGSEMLCLKGHSDEIIAVSASSSGEYALTSSFDSTIRLWDMKKGKELSRIDKVIALTAAMSPDCNLAITGSPNGDIYLWNLRNSKVDHVLKGHSGPVRAVKITADGDKAVSVSDDNTLRIWDLRSKLEIRKLDITPTRILAITDDAGLAMGSCGLIDLKKGRVLYELYNIDDLFFNKIIISPDGGYAASYNKSSKDSKDISLWDLNNCYQQQLKGHQGKIISIAITPDNKKVVSASDDMTLKIWDIQTCKLLKTLKTYKDDIGELTISSDGNSVISTSKSGTVRHWNLNASGSLAMAERHADSVTEVITSKDGSRAISYGKDGRLMIWEIETGDLLHVLSGHSRPIAGIWVDKIFENAVSVNYDGIFVFYNLKDGLIKKNDSYFSKHKKAENIFRFLFSSDLKKAVFIQFEFTKKKLNKHYIRYLKIKSIFYHLIKKDFITDEYKYSYNTTLFRWDIETKKINVLDKKADLIGIEKFTTCPPRVISTSKNNEQLNVWDLESSERILRHKLFNEESISAVAITTNGRIAIAGTDRGRVRYYDLEKKIKMLVVNSHAHKINVLTVSPDGRYLLSASEDGVCRIWKILSRSIESEFHRQNTEVSQAAITPNSEMVMTAYADRILILWNLNTGKTIASFSSDSGITTLKAATNDRFVAGTKDGAVHILHLRT